MSNHWGGELLNQALTLAEAHGFFEKHSPEKVRTLLVELVNMAVEQHDCNAHEILDQIGPRHGLCFYCLKAASEFDDEGICPTCSVELGVGDEEEEIPGLFVSLDGSIPFDNLRPWQIAERAQMQSHLSEFEPRPGQLLIAQYSGPKHPRSDVENLLFYNIGSECFRSAFKYGLQFEQMSRPTSRCEYRYHLADPDQALKPQSWSRVERLASFTELAIPAPNARWAHQVWHSVRTARIPAESVYRGPFEVVLNLRSPAGTVPKIGPARLKKLLDGLVSAYQWNSQDKQLSVACDRLARETGRPAQQLRELLCDSQGAVLGSPGELLRPYREGVQWNPDDHQCVAGTVKWLQGTDAHWILSADIWSLEAIDGP